MDKVKDWVMCVKFCVGDVGLNLFIMDFCMLLWFVRYN